MTPRPERQVFTDVRVVPTELPDSLRFRGGPVWPDFNRQLHARHCRGVEPTPSDEPPRGTDGEAKALPRGVWCGPIVRHFGHMIADFGMRIAASVAEEDPDLPLIFSRQPTQGRPRPYFYEMLAHFGVGPERPRMVRSPIHLRTLVVHPQAERLDGGGPSEAHLDRLDALERARGPAPSKDIHTLYVSRAAKVMGGIAGEGYLETVLAQLRVPVLRPETASLSQQLDLYRRARHIVFAEGSAVHALQLFGRLDADVSVIARRPGEQLARANLLPRARRLTYVDAVAGLVSGLMPVRGRDTTRGVTVLDDRALLEQLGAIGLHLRPHWSPSDYRRARAADIVAWRAERARLLWQRPVEPLLTAGAALLALARAR